MRVLVQGHLHSNLENKYLLLGVSTYRLPTNKTRALSFGRCFSGKAAGGQPGSCRGESAAPDAHGAFQPGDPHEVLPHAEVRVRGRVVPGAALLPPAHCAGQEIPERGGRSDG